MVTSVMPSDLACSYINPSTSDDTAEVHSSRMAKAGRWNLSLHENCLTRPIGSYNRRDIPICELNQPDYTRKDG